MNSLGDDTHIPIYGYGIQFVAERVARMPIPESDVQRQLKEQITLHTNKASGLKGFLNSRLSIAQLPPEILAEIFLYQAAVLRKERIALHVCLDADDADLHKTFYRWLNVSHVCRHWREVALGCAHLWTWVAFQERINIHLIEKMAERALDLPLTYVNSISSHDHCPSCIDMDRFFERTYSGLQLMIKYFDRIRDLTIFMERDEFFNVWDSLTGHCAPLVEVLHLEATAGYRVSKHHRRQPSIVLYDDTLLGSTPRLRSLSLVGLGFSFNDTIAHVTTTLRHLEIRSCACAEEEEDPLLSDFLAALRNLPSLETLKLDWSLENMVEDIEGDHAPPGLTHLKLLHLTSNPYLFAIIVQHLDLAHKISTTVHYACSGENPSDVDPESSQRDLKQAFGLLFKRTPVQVLSFRHHCQSGEDSFDQEGLLASYRVWTFPSPDVGVGEQTPSTMAIDSLPPRLVVDDFDGLDFHIILRAFSDSVSLARAETILFEGLGDYNWGAYCKDASSVTTLRVSGTAVCGIATILSSPVDEETPEYDASEDNRTDVNLLTEEDAVVEGDEDAGFEDGGPPNARAPELHAGPASVEPREPHFPRLRTLKFVGIDVPPLATDDSPYLVDHSLSPELLTNCLASRRHEGVDVIERIEFEHCRIGDLERLRPIAEAVKEILWDGQRVIKL